MEKDFYKKRLREKYGIQAVVPDEKDREEVHRIIFGELCAGKVEPASKERLKKIIGRLASKGAQGVILGCTEIPLIIGQKDSSIPVFDTTRIHAMAAVRQAMDG
jgi:aspartate racemase